MRASFVRRLGIVALLALSLAATAPGATQAAQTQTAKASPTKARPADRCVPFKWIDNWRNTEQIERAGFNVVQLGEQASIGFERERRESFVALGMASNPSSSQLTASRITEVDAEVPSAERVKCWQATEKRSVVVEMRVRFDQAAPPPNMTEAMFLWNAPFGSGSTVTTFGVSRNQGRYTAVILQDFSFTTFTGLFNQKPMPTWLDASKWHRVRITLSQTSAKVEVAQASNPYTVVAQSTLLRPADALDFELSVDNEFFPGRTGPVVVADTLEVDYIVLREARNR